MTQTPMRRSRRSSLSSSPGRSSTGRTGTGRTSTGRTSTGRAASGRTASGPTATRTDLTRPRPVRESAGVAKPSTAADRALERRRRRTTRMTHDRFDHSGRTIRGSLAKVPFIALIIVVLAAGAVGVLLLNTRTSVTGVQINRVQVDSASTQLEIESLQREVSLLDSTPNLAARAKAQGLVPAGDSAIVNCSSTPCTVIKPSAAPGAGG